MTLFPDMPYVANDEQMETLENGQVSKLQLLSDKKLLKGIRRRNFLDVCREAAVGVHKLL